jgi:phosphatidyl-myo-inositol dimannoside synthase
MKLSILALVTDAYGGRGGIAQYNRDFLGAVAESSFCPSITVLPRRVHEVATAPKAIQQLPPRRSRIRYSVAALRAVLFRKVDLVFCGHIFMAPLALLIARLERAQLIVQTHGIEAWRRPSALQRAALERADLVLCVSRYTRAVVLSCAAVAPERVLVVPNTVRDEFMPGEGRKIRAATGLEGKQVLLTVGRMNARERYKGHDRVIAAIVELVARGHDICYLIVGEGDDGPRLEALARKAGVRNRVRFLGPLTMANLVDTYRAADLFIMPSTGEGFGIAFLEAMATGTPALGLASAGAQDVLADGELGTMTSESELVTSISRLLLEPKPDSEKLRSAVDARFGRDKFTANVRAVLQRLAEVR